MSPTAASPGICGDYYGYVIGFPVATPQKPTGWHTMALQGGIWGPGALPTDGKSIFPVTGNTRWAANATWGGGEAVIRLAPGPTFSGNTADYYAPALWLNLDHGDTDLGGASEVLLDMPGAKYPHLVIAGGKDSNLYVLNRDNLGGIGAELLMTKVATNQIKGAPAAYTTAQGTYVAFHIEGGTGAGCPSGQGGNLVVLKIAQSATAVTATTAWCSTQGGLASPMVTTTDGKSNADRVGRGQQALRMERRHGRGHRRWHQDRDVDQHPGVEHAHRRQGPHGRRRERAALRIHAVNRWLAEP